MEISVIVTNYNYEKYIARCIRSLLNQSLDHSMYEIVVVDDASTDNSKDIIESFLKNKRREGKKEEEGGIIEFIGLSENQGLASSANLGFKHCTGRLVVRVDSDDYVHPNFLETFVIASDLMSLDFEAFACDYIEVDNEGREIRRVCAKHEPIACGIAFNHDTLSNLGAYKDGLRIWEDRELMSRFDSSNRQIQYIGLPLYRYRKHPTSLTAGRDR